MQNIEVAQNGEHCQNIEIISERENEARRQEACQDGHVPDETGAQQSAWDAVVGKEKSWRVPQHIFGDTRNEVTPRICGGCMCFWAHARWQGSWDEDMFQGGVAVFREVRSLQ